MAKEMLSRHREVGEGGPTTFEEARDLAKVQLDTLQLKKRDELAAAAKGEAARIPEIKKEQEECRNEAVRLYNRALELQDTETHIDEINVIRYFLCYLHYDAGNYYDAAVLGSFLARHYPKSSGARPGAKIALAGYLQAYNSSKPENRTFEAGQMVQVADLITKTWPTEAEADEAWMILGDLAIREQNLEKAAEYLNKIPEDSPRRGDADLKAGQALWGTYLAAHRLPDDQRPQNLDELAQQAQQTLERGVQRMRAVVSDSNPVTYTLLASELSLAQIYIGSGQAEKAVTLLETANNGVLAMVEAKDELVEKGNFPEEAYKAALRAYVGAKKMDEAEKMMAALDARVKQKGDDATLTRIYISLGRELGEQVEVLRNSQADPKKAAELQTLLQGFEAFLRRISGRTEGNTFSSLNWVGETFFNMAEKLDTGGALSAQAKTYYTNAMETYQGLIDRCKSGAIQPPSGPDSLTALEIRIAMCQRRLGQFKEALYRLGGILLKNPKMLEAQRQAAYTYQEWAETDATYYTNAMRGGLRSKSTGQNVVWGWAQLAVMVQRSPQYNWVFHEARYNLAECRFQMAMAQKNNAAEQANLLGMAERDISIVYKLRPDMGGEEMYKKYESLLNRIQSAARKKPTGLAGLATSTSTTTASTK
jgi:tetratricopeptide (TPR) repeat protein